MTSETRIPIRGSRSGGSNFNTSVTERLVIYQDSGKPAGVTRPDQGKQTKGKGNVVHVQTKMNIYFLPGSLWAAHVLKCLLRDLARDLHVLFFLNINPAAI